MAVDHLVRAPDSYPYPEPETESEMHWQSYANCLNAPDKSVFFPTTGENLKLRAAQAICDSCLVKDECLEYAVNHNERFGVWGGKSERERRRIRKWLLQTK